MSDYAPFGYPGPQNIRSNDPYQDWWRKLQGMNALRTPGDSYYLPNAPSGVPAFPIPTPPVTSATDAVAMPPAYFKDQSQMLQGHPNDPMNQQLQQLLMMLYNHSRNQT